MSDGRKSQVVLLDERRLDIVIQPKLYTSDLLDMVSSHFRLKEKQYFGIAFIDDTGHYNWLSLEKRVLDHDFPKKSGVLVLHFSIRFYIETIGLLRDTPTIELFYLNARQAVFKGLIECDSETVFELAAHVLQFSNGDFVSEEETRNELKKLPVIPTFVLKEHPSIGYCEDRVIQHYQKLAGTSQGLAIVNYMTIVEKVPTYGIHCYEVKDKKSIPWWLGISPKGIYLFDKNDKSIPRKIFLWKSLENLYYRDKKFSIEVHDPKRVVHTLSSFNLYEDAIKEPAQSFDSLSDAISDPTTQVSVSRRTFGAGNVNVHAWFAATPQLTKCIWSMSVSQHQFYLDRKQSKSHLPSARSMSEIAADLCRSTTSLPGSIGSDISRSTSSQSLPSLTSSRFDLNIEQADTLKAQREMYQALKARKEALEEALRKKTEDLKNLCFQEGELTGELPADTPLEPGEKAPAFRRRVGTSFSLTKNLQQESGNEREDIIAKLELEYELQSKITAAAFKLSQDKAVGKSVRKQRRQAYTRALNKLKDMEKKLSDMRRNLGLSTRVIQPTSGYNENEMFSPISPATSPPVYRAVSNRQQQTQVDGSHHQRQHHRQPEHVQNQQHHQSRATRPQAFQTSHPHSHSHLENHVVPNHLIALSPSHSSPQLTAGSGYQPSNVYTTKTSYRSQMYPTLTNRSQSSSSNQSEYDNMRSGGRLEGSLDSGFSSANNMYNITSQQKSHYDSTDRLKSPVQSVYDKTLTTKHGSLEGAYRKKTNNSGNSYGSLERNRNKKKDYSNNSGQYNDPRSHYGGKRESGSEYSDPETPTPKTSHRVEVPVHHETDESHYYTTKQFLYGDSFTSQDLSPLPPTSPRKEYTDHVLREHVNEQSYSPRTYESSYSRSERCAYSPNYEHDISSSSINVKRIESQPSASKLVTVKPFQPHTEVTKPYEISDYYKYSERIRRQRQVDVYQKQLIGVERLSRCSTPSQSSDGDYTSNTSHTSQPGSPYHGTTHTNYRGDYHQAYSPGPASPDISTSTAYHSVKAPGIQYSTKTVYKSQHIESGAPKHSTYQAPRPMTCQPVKNMYSTSASPSPVPSRQGGTSLTSSDSTSSFTAPHSLVDGFSDEVLAWLDDQNTPQPPTLV